MKRIFFYYLKPYYLRMAWGLLIKFAGTMMDLFLPWALAYMIDAVIPANDTDQILLWGGFMVACSVLAAIFNIIANRMASRVASDAVYVMRKDLFDKVMYLANRQTDELTRPSLISRLTSDTYNIHQMLARIQRLGVRAPILLLGGIVMMLGMDAPLATILVVMLPAIALIVYFVTRASVPLYTQEQGVLDKVVRVLQENITGIRVIKALSKTEYEKGFKIYNGSCRNDSIGGCLYERGNKG